MLTLTNRTEKSARTIYARRRVLTPTQKANVANALAHPLIRAAMHTRAGAQTVHPPNTTHTFAWAPNHTRARMDAAEKRTTTRARMPARRHARTKARTRVSPHARELARAHSAAIGACAYMHARTSIRPHAYARGHPHTC
eukprot:451119-Pleurochrysis_carterae.AAC.3